jgi:hypothetical protein
MNAEITEEKFRKSSDLRTGHREHCAPFFCVDVLGADAELTTADPVHHVGDFQVSAC